MTRPEFTKKIARFIVEMAESGENPVIDSALRFAEDQFRLFKIGRKANEDGTWEVVGNTVTNCDGFTKKSAHQSGKAVDIYLTDEQGNIQFEWDKDEAVKWHQIWTEKYGGDEMIPWDAPHFQGKP